MMAYKIIGKRPIPITRDHTRNSKIDSSGKRLDVKNAFVDMKHKAKNNKPFYLNQDVKKRLMNEKINQ